MAILDIHTPSVTFTGANTFNINLSIPASALQTLGEIKDNQVQILQEIQSMTAEVQKVLDAVTVIKDRDAALITLVNGLGAKIQESIDDKPALLAIAADLTQEASVVNDAVVANTPPDSADTLTA